MKSAKKTKKTLLERVLGKAPEPEYPFQSDAKSEPEEQAAAVVAEAGISEQHAPHVAQLISTSLSQQSSLTRETY